MFNGLANLTRHGIPAMAGEISSFSRLHRDVHATAGPRSFETTECNVALLANYSSFAICDRRLEIIDGRGPADMSLDVVEGILTRRALIHDRRTSGVKN